MKNIIYFFCSMVTMTTNFICLDDYLKNDVIMSYEELRNFKFRQHLKQPLGDNEIVTTQINTSKIHVNYKANNNIICGIQNDENFIKFITSIKSKSSVVVVIYVLNDVLCCLIKPYITHPILMFNLPIDNENIYSRINNVYFDLPVDKINIKTSIQHLINMGYSLYYTQDNNNISLHFDTKNEKIAINLGIERNWLFVNRCLRPSVHNNTHEIVSFSTNNDVDNLTNIKNAKILIMQQIKNNSTFINDMGTKQNDVMLIDVNSYEMKITVISEQNINYEKTLLKNVNSIMWKHPNNVKYDMSRQIQLLKSNSTTRIVSGSYTYCIFASFNDDYYILVSFVSMKHFSAETNYITKHLNDFIEDNYCIYTMFYCKKHNEEDETTRNYVNLNDSL